MIKLDKLYFGIVEDYAGDPTLSGKVRVRILGIHSDNKKLVPTSSLPFANYITSCNNPYLNGIGISPSFFLNGSMTVLIPIDNALQEWLIIGQLPRSDYEYINNSYGFNSDGSVANPVAVTNKLAGGIPSEYIKSNMYVTKVGNQDSNVEVYNNPVVEEKVPVDINQKVKQYMDLAMTQLNINERDNPDIIKGYLKYAGIDGNPIYTSWCSAFVCAMLEQCDIKSTKSGLARSYLKYGNKAEIKYGSIIVFGSSKSAWQGHVGFCIQDNGDTIRLLAGNQSDVDNRSGGRVSITNIKKNGQLIYLDSRLPNL